MKSKRRTNQKAAYEIAKDRAKTVDGATVHRSWYDRQVISPRTYGEHLRRQKK